MTAPQPPAMARTCQRHLVPRLSLDRKLVIGLVLCGHLLEARSSVLRRDPHCHPNTKTRIRPIYLAH